MEAGQRKSIEAVSTCKFVHRTIPGAPCTRGALDAAFIRKHNIHIVCCGEEYNKPDDLWYKIPRDMGILRYLPRTEGMSTSTLIRRIQQRYAEEGEDRPKDKPLVAGPAATTPKASANAKQTPAGRGGDAAGDEKQE